MEKGPCSDIPIENGIILVNESTYLGELAIECRCKAKPNSLIKNSLLFICTRGDSLDQNNVSLIYKRPDSCVFLSIKLICCNMRHLEIDYRATTIGEFYIIELCWKEYMI